MPTNTAAWLPKSGADLAVGPAPYPTPGPDQIVVRARAVAVNPLDWIVQRAGFTYSWLRYPAVLGADVAGEVVEVGPDVTRFAVGDRVAGYAIGLEKDRNIPAEGAFQSFVVLMADLATPLPDALSVEQAAVLPLAVSTAASALFQQSNLGLRLPTADSAPTGETVLIWGASTSVGANAVQLARAAGYDVIATASPRNFELVRSFGATAVFDYRGATVVAQIQEALGERPLAGAFAVGAGSTEPCFAIVRAASGPKRLVSASTAVSLDRLRPGRGLMLRALPTLLRIGSSVVGTRLRARRAGLRATMVWGSSLKDNEVGPAIWRNFLPTALAEGTIRPVPEPLVVGHGLAAIQSAMERQRAGVSASKLVVTL